MSEESKSDSDYVHMRHGADVRPGLAVKLPSGLDDPNLSQEDRDLRLAIALQQQENAAVYDHHKKKHGAVVAANFNRTARSGAHSGLAAIRDKDHGMLRVPKEYSTENAYVADDGDYAAPQSGIHMGSRKGMAPQELADAQLAAELQKVEQASAGTANTMQKILTEEKKDTESHTLRTTRSGTPAFHKIKK